MSPAQRVVLVVAFVLLAGQVLCPPWKYVTPAQVSGYGLSHQVRGASEVPAGYWPLWDPPLGAPAAIDMPRLVLPLLVVLVGAAGAYAWAGKAK